MLKHKLYDVLCVIPDSNFVFDVIKQVHFLKYGKPYKYPNIIIYSKNWEQDFATFSYNKVPPWKNGVLLHMVVLREKAENIRVGQSGKN